MYIRVIILQYILFYAKKCNTLSNNYIYKFSTTKI